MYIYEIFSFSVIPAKAGSRVSTHVGRVMDSRLRGDDKKARMTLEVLAVIRGATYQIGGIYEPERIKSAPA
jgi:hypothetical protein